MRRRTVTNNVQCLFCDCVYPAEHNECLVCGTENPARAWEAKEAKRLREEPMGYEAAWTGFPSDLAKWSEAIK
jgi:hypothetical protein